MQKKVYVKPVVLAVTKNGSNFSNSCRMSGMCTVWAKTA